MQADQSFQLTWVQHLDSKWGSAANGGVRYYVLDNEPSIWHETHRDIHPNGSGMEEVRDKMLVYSGMIKTQDPTAYVIGPEEFGWSGYWLSGIDLKYGGETGDWSNLPDKKAHGGADYLPWVLQQLKSHEGILSRPFALYMRPPRLGMQGHLRLNDATSRIRARTMQAGPFRQSTTSW